jgi:hypothetical protein
VREGLAVLGALVELAVWAELVALAETGRRNGSTTHNIAAALRMETGLRQTGLVARLVGTRWPIVRPVRRTRSGARAVTWAPTAAERVVSVELVVEEASAEPEGLAEPATAEVLAERTILAAATCRAAEAATGTPSEGETRVTTDRARAPAAIVARPAWDLAAAVAVHVAAAGGAGKACNPGELR